MLLRYPNDIGPSIDKTSEAIYAPVRFEHVTDRGHLLYEILLSMPL